jgi:DNA polymerase
MNPSARIMVVGQNPGLQEVSQGEPFVGQSGKIFNEILNEIVGIDRGSLYISNVVRCYTPKNRKPKQQELDNCRGFLDREIEIVNPDVVIALGSFAFKQLTGMSGIMKHCGEVVVSPRYRVQVVAMLHPSPLNMNNPDRRKLFEKSMRTVVDLLKDG